MAEWPSDLGVATLTGRVLLMQGDQSDPDRVPDVRAAEGGTVEVEASVPAVRYSGADGTALFVKQVTRGVLDGQGRICTPAAGEDDPVPDLIVPAVDSPLLSPSDFTYRVRIKVGPWVTSYSIAPGTGEVIDLATATPVDSSGGTAIIVDTSTADRAEAAAAAAEATVAGIDQAIADAIASDPNLKGDPGTDGASAYDVAVAGGFVGTEAEWVASLDGEDSAPGPANVLSIGTVSSGTTASATITGDSPAQVLSLVLPKGDKGDRGEQGIPGTAELPTTGWRDVTSLWSGISRGRVLIRRDGPLCTFRWEEAEYSQTSVATANLSGFSPRTPGSFGLVYTVATPPVFRRFTSNGSGNLALVNPATGTAYLGEFTCITDDPWPATLPGTPA